MKYVKQFSIILGISFLAELLEILIPLPIAASVYGLVIMLVGLITKLIPLEKVETAAKADNRPAQLSGGQQQRVAIARALAAKPAILLADEPTGNLDSATSLDVMGLLKVTAQKFSQTIVMITHDSSIALEAKRVVRIHDGKINFDGDVKKYAAII